MQTQIIINEPASGEGSYTESSADNGLTGSHAVAEWESQFFLSQLHHSNKLQRIQDLRMQDEIEELQEKLAKFIADNFRNLLDDWQKMDAGDRLIFYRTLIQKIFPEAFVAAQIEGHDDYPF